MNECDCWRCSHEEITNKDILNEELIRLREIEAKALQIIEFADGHPDMCCGKCSEAIYKAEEEANRLREENKKLLEATKELREGDGL